MTNNRPPTYDRLVSGKKPHFAKVSICLDPELTQEFQEAQKTKRDAWIRAQAENVSAEDKARLQEDLEAAEEAVLLLTPQVEEETIVFKIKSIGRNKYENMLLAHPPTEEQVRRAEKYADLMPGDNTKDTEGLLWNPETYPIALISACLVEPKLSLDEVQGLWDSEEWSGVDLMTLFFNCQAVNARGSQVDLGKG